MFLVAVLEFLHEFSQCCGLFHCNRVVEANTKTADGSVALCIEESALCSLRQPNGFKVLIGNVEDNVYTTARTLSYTDSKLF